MRTRAAWAIAAVCILVASDGRAQGLTGTLLGTVTDEQGAVLQGARVHLSSPSLIGGPVTIATNERGQLRFPVLWPGAYTIDVELPGFTSLHEEGIQIGAGATISRTVILKVAGVADSIIVEGAGSRMEARGTGIATRIGPEYLRTIPSRRYSMFDGIRSVPGVSPTSPTSGTVNTVAAFGSGGNENLFLIDGTNFTCPCSGVARAEPSTDVIQEIQIQSVGVSVEYGNIGGSVFNVVTRQGGDRFQYDASYYGQAAGLTSQPYAAACVRHTSADRIRARSVSRFHRGCRRPRCPRSCVVLHRLPVPARLRQPARDGSDAAEKGRAEQGFWKADVEAGPQHATRSELQRRTLDKPADAYTRYALRSHAAPERVGTDDDLRPVDAYTVPRHRMGSARGPLRVSRHDDPIRGAGRPPTGSIR